MAAELKIAQPDKDVVLVHSRSKLLTSEPLPDDYRDNVLSLLHETGVETIMNSRVTEITPSEPRSGFAPSTILKLDDGRTIKASHVISAISKYRPTSSYLPREAVDEEGYVKITPLYAFILYLFSSPPFHKHGLLIQRQQSKPPH